MQICYLCGRKIIAYGNTICKAGQDVSQYIYGDSQEVNGRNKLGCKAYLHSGATGCRQDDAYEAVHQEELSDIYAGGVVLLA